MGEQSRKEKRVLQWHPAFFAGLRIEFGDEREKLRFESEYQLGTRPKEIDVLIVKDSKEPIEKNIGRIFRKYNIVEYKSPEDYLSIDDFYKVYGYACFYKADTGQEDEVRADEMTVSFVCKRYPHKLINHLKAVRHLDVIPFDAGIYYIIGDVFPMQLIVTSRLSAEQNFWLSNLRDDIKEPESIRRIATEYQKHRGDGWYRSVMNIIVRANETMFKEEKTMCEAIIELFREEYDAGIEDALQRGMERGMESGLLQGALQQLVELVRDNLLPVEEAVKRAKISREEFMALL